MHFKVALKEVQPNEINIVIGHLTRGFQAISCEVLCCEFFFFFNFIITIEPVLIPRVKSKDFKFPTVVPSNVFQFYMEQD